MASRFTQWHHKKAQLCGVQCHCWTSLMGGYFNNDSKANWLPSMPVVCRVLMSGHFYSLAHSASWTAAAPANHVDSLLQAAMGQLSLD